MHQGANFDHLKLPPSKIGLDFQLPSDVFKYCKLSIRNIINKSKNQDMKILLKLKKDQITRYDIFTTNDDSKPKSKLK